MSPAQESVADGQGQESKKPKLTEKQKIIAARIMDEDPQMRKAAVEEYGDQKDKDALPFIMSSTMDDDADVRRAACLALMKMKEPKAMDALAARLKDEDEGVRYWAAKALGESGDPRAVDPLIQSMKKEQDPKARAIMAEGLGDLKGQKAVAALAERLKPALEREADVRMAAVEALGKIGGAEAQSVLKVAAAKDPGRVGQEEGRLRAHGQARSTGEWPAGRMKIRLKMFAAYIHPCLKRRQNPARRITST